MPDPAGLLVSDDEHDFYGKQYYERALPARGYPPLTERARSDLTERCLHWLRYLLRYKLPPGKVLELGCGHGGFVALLRAVGFDASGLELSPWLSQFARNTFDIPVLVGPVEAQNIPPASLDAIVLMDVLEHLPNPESTMRHCVHLLKPDGMLLIQTPKYPEGKSFEQIIAENDRFVDQFKPDQHLYLFSATSVRRLFERLGIENLVFEPAIFSHYDMFLAASRQPLRALGEDETFSWLENHATGRLPLALLDMDAQKRELHAHHIEVEADRAARLAVIQELEARYNESEADRAARLAIIQELEARYSESEADRAARLAVIQELEARYNESEADRAARLAVIQKLEAECAAITSRVASLEQQLASSEERIDYLEGYVSGLDAQCQQQRGIIGRQTELLDRLQGTYVFRGMRRLGLWEWLEMRTPT
jgi:SAM-dependent methyltransferase